MDCVYFAGVEGGGSGSRCQLYRLAKGAQEPEEVATAEGGSTNHYAVGMVQAVEVLLTMLNKCRTDVGLTKPIDAVGMALSGCEGDAMRIEAALRDSNPDVALVYYITSDAIGTLLSCRPNGGVIMICGTGSSAKLLNPDGSLHSCGGHAHLVGDGGSATFIALNAVRTVFNHVDRLDVQTSSVDYIRTAIKDYFNVERLNQMHSHLFSGFDKTHYARFALRIVEGAKEGDELCKRLLYDNGCCIGAHIAAVTIDADPALLSAGLAIVCVGSVWGSWPFMKAGFVHAVKRNHKLKQLQLVRLNIAPAKGIAFFTARKLHLLKSSSKSDNSTELIDTIEL